MNKKFNLEQRLIDYSVSAIELVSRLQPTYSNNHLSNQLIRSTTSTALNYGEAQSAESRRDFIHKCKIILKELRETSVCLKILNQTNVISECEAFLAETEELISIYVKSIQTVRRNNE